MFTENDIYKFFRQEQSNFANRPYRLPKHWDIFFSKMDLNKKGPLETITKFFNTKWQNINPRLYFNIGFKIFGGSFSYHKFFNKKIMDQYINEDRAIKRNDEDVEEDIIKSVDYINDLIESSEVSKLIRYISMFDKERPKAFGDYLSNRIGKYFLIYLLKEGYLKLEREQSGQLVYISKQYDRYIRILNNYSQKTGRLNEILKKVL